MVNIEVGRARMYFSVENRIKLGASRLGYGKYNLWGQNDVVLSMRFFFLIQNTETTSFWFVWDQNVVVLEVAIYKGKLSSSIPDDSEKIKNEEEEGEEEEEEEEEEEGEEGEGNLPAPRRRRVVFSSSSSTQQ